MRIYVVFKYAGLLPITKMNSYETSKQLKLSHKEVFIMVFVLMFLWFPVFTPVHVEGFSASIQSIAMHLVSGDLLNYDRIFPFNLEYYFNSRFGMNAFVATVMKVLPAAESEWAMRITMWLGFLMLVPASIFLIRRWSSTDWAVALGLMILLPGVAETAFFYNENVLSAGISVTAISLCVAARHWAVLVAAGILFGSAILVRPDSVLLLPVVSLIIWRNFDLGAIFIKCALLFGLGMLSVMLLAKATFGVDFFQTMEIANYALKQWDNPLNITRQRYNLLTFIGIPGAIFITLGILRIFRSKDWYFILLLVGVPIFYNLIYWGKLAEMRYLLPLTPFFCALAAHGIRALCESPFPLRACIIASCFLVMIAPPVFTGFSEGPRSKFGRIWTPFLWKEWQGDIREDFDRIDNFVGAFQTDGVVITDDWDIDRYVHLALQKAGYKVFDDEKEGEACSHSGEVFRKNGITVTHIRLHTPMLPFWRDVLPERFDAYVPECILAARNPDVFFIAQAKRIHKLTGVAVHSPNYTEHERPISWVLRMYADWTEQNLSIPGVWRLLLPRYGFHTSTRLDHDNLANLREAYEKEVSASNVIPPTLSESEHRLESKFNLAK